MHIAVIAGSGIPLPDWLSPFAPDEPGRGAPVGVAGGVPVEETVHTPYGKATLARGRCGGTEVGWLFRHGRDHSLPPHLVNYRANVWALKTLGVERVIALNAVGSLRPDLPPGNLVLVHQFLDFTRQRASTFYDGREAGAHHVDLTEPYCPFIREVVRAVAEELGLQARALWEGVYVCTEGPRYETPAEVKAFRLLGGDVVGMTGVPEVILAREAGLCYASLAMVTNFAAGISPRPLDHGEVVRVMTQQSRNISRLLRRTIELLPPRGRSATCPCASPLR